MPNPVKTRAEVTEVKSYGAGVYSVKFKPLGLTPRAKPGQFLHLTVDEYDPAGGFWPESRVFSIASAPGAGELEIVYSVKGRYTRRMEESLAPGREVWLKLPYGEFIIENAVGPGQDAVLVAGGTGVSPFLPYLEKILAAGRREREVRLYYGVRENSMLLAGNLIGRCAEAGLAEARILVEDEDPDGRIPAGAKSGRGRLDIDNIRGECAGLAAPVYFLSGPPAMIKTFKDRLGASGVEAGNIKIDEWE